MYSKEKYLAERSALEKVNADLLDRVSTGYRGLSGHRDIEILRQALLELDRLRLFKEKFDAYTKAEKCDFIIYENWQECEASIISVINKLEARIKMNEEIKRMQVQLSQIIKLNVENPPKQNPTVPTHKPVTIGDSAENLNNNSKGDK